MTQPLRLVLIFHNHQPVGNFDHVFEQAYQDSYLPFLDVFEKHTSIQIALHTSGCLMEWFEKHHPEYLDRLAGLVEAGRIEIVGGAFYEPILTMIPSRDRVGQISSYTSWLQNRLGAKINGMWVPERVWEQSLTRDIVDAGISYTVLDDFHFKSGGMNQEQLQGYYLTEDDTRLLNVFPGSERLRYLIPFAEPHETIDYLRSLAEQYPGAVVAFGDDGEKFGTWPGTKEHVYTNGWLERFFEALAANADWLKVTTPTEAIENVPPLGKFYIPDASYREMTEWALPAKQIHAFDHLKHRLEDEGRWDEVAKWMRGGFWRNFKVKYPETNEMYARMQMVSRRLAEVDEQTQGPQPENSLVEQARRELYRGQCNCSYWHGAFGGVYLPHLRNAIFNHLIAADNLLDQQDNRSWHQGSQPWVDISAEDYNFDGRQEIRLTNNRLLALVAPAKGGHLIELDVRSICHNLLATLTRREEAYHEKIKNGPSAAGDNVASIHDQVIFKQEGLDERLQYDWHARKSLVDHFYDLDVSRDAIEGVHYHEQGDFVLGEFETTLRRSPERMQMQLTRTGTVAGHSVKMTKGITLTAGSSQLEIAYLLEGLPADESLHFGVEFNFAGLPSGADDRFFHGENGESIGQLGERLDLIDMKYLGLTDQWLGIDVQLAVDRPTSFWTFPIETVSQSESGFELVHQSVMVEPHWIVQSDPNGCWSVTMQLTMDTSAAEERMKESVVAASV